MKAEYYIVDDSQTVTKTFRALSPVVLRSAEEVVEAVEGRQGNARRRRAVWIARSDAAAGWLTLALAGRRGRSRDWCLALAGAEGVARHVLTQRLERVVYGDVVQLPNEELVEVLGAPSPQDYCVGGAIDVELGVAVLVRGDLSSLVVPLSSFAPSGSGVVPNFGDFEVDDFGQTLRFGEYEAAFDVVLYEHDSEYRKRLRRKREASEQTLGASIRRLRKQRGLARDAFDGLAARTLARIERGEVEEPHTKTLELIARRLGVEVAELGEY